MICFNCVNTQAPCCFRIEFDALEDLGSEAAGCTDPIGPVYVYQQGTLGGCIWTGVVPVWPRPTRDGLTEHTIELHIDAIGGGARALRIYVKTSGLGGGDVVLTFEQIYPGHVDCKNLASEAIPFVSGEFCGGSGNAYVTAIDYPRGSEDPPECVSVPMCTCCPNGNSFALKLKVPDGTFGNQPPFSPDCLTQQNGVTWIVPGPAGGCVWNTANLGGFSRWRVELWRIDVSTCEWRAILTYAHPTQRWEWRLQEAHPIEDCSAVRTLQIHDVAETPESCVLIDPENSEITIEAA